MMLKELKEVLTVESQRRTARKTEKPSHTNWLLRQDLYGRRAARYKGVVSRYAVERDTYWNTLGQTHPAKRWIDVGKQGCALAAITVFNAGGNAFYVPRELSCVPHE